MSNSSSNNNIVYIKPTIIYQNEINDKRENPTSYVDQYLYSDIGSDMFDAFIPDGALSFYNLGIVHVDYIEMSREAQRITEISTSAMSQLGVLAGAISALASLVGYSLDLSGFDMQSLGLDSFPNVSFEDNYDGMSLADATSSSYMMGLADNISYAVHIMNTQMQQYKDLSGMTSDEITKLDSLVNQVLVNPNLFYTDNSGEGRYISYNSLLNAYKAKERQMYQIDNINLYNADGSVNQDALDSLRSLLADEVANRSGKFMTSEEGNSLGYLQCTWWANARASQFLGENYPTLWGNGGQYYSENEKNKWFEYGSEPRPNSLVTYVNDGAGHVAYVEAVDKVNGKIYISDADGVRHLWLGVEELDMDGKWNGLSPVGYIYLDSPIDNSSTTDTNGESK